MRCCQHIGVVLALTALCGCVWQQEPDSVTASFTVAGIHANGSNEAVWLAAPRPGLSAVGKDYLFVGPMTVNREGSPGSFLWFAVGTTIDRHLTGAPKPTLDTVVLLVDGTPMTFDLSAWDNGAEASPYSLSIDSDASYVARVTSSQVRQIANADRVDAYVVDANGRSPTYSVVSGDPAKWLTFGGP